MDTLASLSQKYQDSLASDILGGCYTASMQTQTLLAFVQEVIFRQSASVNDVVTANQLLTYTYQNYQ
jgi:hypothetical protein